MALLRLALTRYASAHALASAAHVGLLLSKREPIQARALASALSLPMFSSCAPASALPCFCVACSSVCIACACILSPMDAALAKCALAIHLRAASAPPPVVMSVQLGAAFGKPASNHGEARTSVSPVLGMIVAGLEAPVLPKTTPIARLVKRCASRLTFAM